MRTCPGASCAIARTSPSLTLTGTIHPTPPWSLRHFFTSCRGDTTGHTSKTFQCLLELDTHITASSSCLRGLFLPTQVTSPITVTLGAAVMEGTFQHLSLSRRQSAGSLQGPAIPPAEQGGYADVHTVHREMLLHSVCLLVVKHVIYSRCLFSPFGFDEKLPETWIQRADPRAQLDVSLWEEISPAGGRERLSSAHLIVRAMTQRTQLHQVRQMYSPYLRKHPANPFSQLRHCPWIYHLKHKRPAPRGQAICQTEETKQERLFQS